jgi:hypothetical protein
VFPLQPSTPTRIATQGRLHRFGRVLENEFSASREACAWIPRRLNRADENSSAMLIGASSLGGGDQYCSGSFCDIFVAQLIMLHLTDQGLFLRSPSSEIVESS